MCLRNFRKIVGAEVCNKHCFQFLLEPFQPPRETEDNAFAKFGGDKQRALSYVMVFSGVVNCSEVEQATSFACSGEVIPVFFNS